jgi:hypothetical protein
MYHQKVIKMNKLIENIILNKGKKKKDMDKHRIYKY